MKYPVTLKEIVATKIVYAVLVALYYWMWARRDWQDYYMTIQYAVCTFTVVFFAIRANRVWKYSKEETDELAIQNLRRADSICLKIMVTAAVVIAFACAVTYLDGRMAGYALVGSVLLLSVVRFAAFCIMDDKGV